MENMSLCVRVVVVFRGPPYGDDVPPARLIGEEGGYWNRCACCFPIIAKNRVIRLLLAAAWYSIAWTHHAEYDKKKSIAPTTFTLIVLNYTAQLRYIYEG